MAEAATLPRRPEHLRALELEARGIVEHWVGRTLHHPDDTEEVARVYLILRVQAYQREMQPFVRAAARSLALRLRPAVVSADGNLVPEETSDPLDVDIRKWLDEAGDIVRQRYELPPIQG
jgi:hypothetical protein